jgi:YVTN family beta-propeller protein
VHPNRPLVANVNYDSASVTMIDSTTDEVVATVAVGKNPQDISWAPDGRHAYVANTSDGTVSVIDAETETVTATIPAGKSPTSVAVLPDGSAAYVSNLGDGTLSVLKIAG